MKDKLNEYFENLKKANVTIDKGLSQKEFKEIEKKYNFVFPPDLKEFLGIGLPISNNWVDWRRDSGKIKDRLNWPYEGICFDIEHNAFWLDDWAEKPENLKERFQIAKKKLKEAPTLIPICSHRYIPDKPCEEGNPVLSVYQTDIIYYGSDIYNYIENEYYYYFGRKGYKLNENIKEIDFWTKLIELNS